MRYLRVSELVSKRTVGRKSCKDQMLFIFLSFYLENWNVNIHINFYYSTQHSVAFRKWSQCNKARRNYFSEGWQTVPEYSTHFHFDSFSASQKPGETQPLHVWHVDFLILLYLIKEELLAQQQLAVSCVSRIYLATIISKRRVKEIKEACLHWESDERTSYTSPTSLDSPPPFFFAPALSFSCGLIQMVLSWH